MEGELARPLREGEEEDTNQGTGCVGLVVWPVIVYYAAAIGLAVLFSYASYYHYFTAHHREEELPSYLYVLPYEFLAVVAAILATVNATHHFTQHVFINQNGWALKITILVILSMVPVYAVCSALALISNQNRFHFSVLLNAFREFYEAMVLIAFMQFIAEFWGGTLRLSRILDTDDLVLKTVFPTPVCKADELLGDSLGFNLADVRVFPFRRAPGSEYVAWTYVGAVQYAFVMVAYVLANIVMWSWVVHGKMTEESMDFYVQSMQPLKMVSNVWAMYNLLILFEYLRESRNTEPRMNRIRPISKFFCIKLIVLFSLWQENIMRFLANQHLLPTLRGVEMDWSDQKKTAEGAVNFLVCLEMLLFAQWHRYAYPFEEKWDDDDQVVEFERHNHEPCCLLLRCGVGKMMDDVGYLLVNRIPGQHNCVTLLVRRRAGEEVPLDGASELARNFRYFDLDQNGEVSNAQLKHILVASGLASSMEEAQQKLRTADCDENGRLSYEEFTTRLINA